MQKRNPLLEEIFKQWSPRQISDAVITFFSREVERKRICLLEGTPLASPADCFLCRKNCVLAGKKFTWRNA